MRVTDTVTSMTDYDPADKWQDDWMAAVPPRWRDPEGKAPKQSVATHPLLPEAIKYLMTELWDRGFSQTENREALDAAMLAMPIYAGGQERRS
jgi:hypothetical protein